MIMDRTPVVSVVMPVYNAEQYVSDAVWSILGQTYSDLELIAVDDASTDRSVEILRQFTDPRLVVLRQEVNGGYPVAMNTGIARARGRYIARMDADDVVDLRRLEKQVRFLEQHEGFCMVASRSFRLTPFGKTYYPELPMEEEYVVETWEDVMEGTRLFTDAAVLVERQLVLEAGGYRTYRRSGQDVDLWLRILEKGRPLATLTEPLYGRRVLPSALTFAMHTTARNQIPRLLARDRRENGSDAVMRGEAVPAPEEQEAGRAARLWRIQALWTTALRCAEAGDYRGGWMFARPALFAVEPSAAYLRTTTYHLYKGVKFLRNNRRQALPSS